MPKPELAADLGVSTEPSPRRSASRTLGDIGANLAKFNAGDRQVPIRVQLPDERARATAACSRPCGCRRRAARPCRSPPWPTSSFGQGPTAIDRYDRSRRVTIEARLRGTDALGERIEAVDELPTAKNLPPGVEIRETGDAEVMSEVFAASRRPWARAS